MKKLVSLVITACALLVALPAYATNYSLWIHGRTGGTPSGWSYWKNGSGTYIEAGVNPVAVNYDGTAHISVSNPTVVWYLDTYCTGSNSCYISCHSAGCAQIGYAIDKNQPMRWNIDWVSMGGSAMGGSEIAGLASSVSWLTGMPIDNDLPVGTMRGLYNHDSVGNLIWGYVYTNEGASWNALTNCFFPGNGCLIFNNGGENDSAVAYHSSGGFRSSGTYDNSSFNSGNSFWNYEINNHSDGSRSYGHCIASFTGCSENTAGGVMSLSASFMRNYAY